MKIPFFSKSFTEVKMNLPFVSMLRGATGQQIATPLVKRDFLAEYKNWVFACVQARAEEVGNTHLQLFRGDKEIDSHEVLDLLDRPNPIMTRHDLFESYQAFRDLEGNTFWYTARLNNGKGAIVEIWPLRPDKVEIVQSVSNPLQVDGYLFTQPGGKKVRFMPEEIIHFKNFNPVAYHPFPHRGMGIVEAAAWGIDSDNEARNWNYKFFKNSARPDGILTTPGDATTTADELIRIREEWETAHGTSDSAHKVAILSGGLTWTEISRTQKDMDFINQRTFSRDEILALFRVPRTIVGITDDVNRANADASIYVFSLRTVKPLMQRLVRSLNESLLPNYGDDLIFDFKSPVSEDRSQMLDEYSQGIQNGWLTINEVREREGLQKVESGDSLYLPSTYVPVSEATPVPDTPQKSGGKTITRGKVEDIITKFLEEKKVKAVMPKESENKNVKSITAAKKNEYAISWKAAINQNTVPLKKKIVSYFNAQEKIVQRNVREQLKGFLPSEYQYKSVDDMLFDEQEEVGTAISLITPFIKEYIKRSGDAAAQLVDSTFDSTASDIADFIESRAKYFAETINDTTRESLLVGIKAGVDGGETLQQIQDRISAIYAIAKGSRTEMIARTEVSAASNQGAISAYKQADVQKIEWMVVNPEDEDCKGNEGVTVNIGDVFPSGDTQPPIHPNCECTTLPVFD